MITMSAALFSGTGPLVLFIAKATLVLIAAIGATFVLRRGTAGERHLVWLAALVGVLALPLLSRIPALHIGVLPSRLVPAAFAGPETVVIAKEAEGAPVIVTTRGMAAPVEAHTIITTSSGVTVIAPTDAPVAPMI